MTSREKFEAWMTAEQWFHGSDFEWDEHRNCYAQFGIHLAYKAFLAAEGAAEQKLTDLAVQLANAESKCRELAAENAKKSRCLGFFASVIKSGESWTRVCQHEYNEAQETPATDAFLAEVRAQGIERVIEIKQKQLDGLHADTFAIGAVRDSLRRDIYELKVLAEVIRHEPMQLRKGAAL
ncbi:TPA: hypothetical protein R8G83_004168 [Citrobacter youngae]|nr:hypothetical protein [Citrobacter youngae]HEF0092487.1 hypothetical protein [Citrobacter youngae]